MLVLQITACSIKKKDISAAILIDRYKLSATGICIMVLLSEWIAA
jgi:hypothetical protein